MNVIALYMNAIVAMEELCLKRNTGITEHAWSMPQYDLAMDMTSRTDPRYRFPQWGLLTTITAAASRDFTPLLARFTWEGERIGVMQVAFREDLERFGGAFPGNSSFMVSDVAANVTDATSETPLQTMYRLEIRPTYNGRPMTSRQVFDRALRVMVSGSERGIHAVVDGYEDPGIEVTSRRDPATGELLLQWRYVIKAMRILTKWMVAMDRFGEIYVEILRDDDTVGEVRLKQGVGASVS